MKPSKPLLCLSLCAVVALAACNDRRDDYPPNESRTTTDQVTPPGVQGGHVTAPGTPGASDDRCTGLTGDELQACTTGRDGVPMIMTGENARPDVREREATEDAPAADNRTSDRNEDL